MNSSQKRWFIQSLQNWCLRLQFVTYKLDLLEWIYCEFGLYATKILPDVITDIWFWFKMLNENFQCWHIETNKNLSQQVVRFISSLTDIWYFIFGKEKRYTKTKLISVWSIMIIGIDGVKWPFILYGWCWVSFPDLPNSQ